MIKLNSVLDRFRVGNEQERTKIQIRKRIENEQGTVRTSYPKGAKKIVKASDQEKEIEANLRETTQKQDRIPNQNRKGQDNKEETIAENRTKNRSKNIFPTVFVPIIFLFVSYVFPIFLSFFQEKIGKSRKITGNDGKIIGK